ncbi:hypothetical protein Syun_030393 [Stephania yunnanensis]|uniref:Uncharacterized protein n=1 Tax=Stephania yunnanensis TaxID=152371 RepID=A0AAP0EFQ3_9MAGN
MFETDTDEEVDGKLERPLYLDEFEKFPSGGQWRVGGFQRASSTDFLKLKEGEKELELPEIDEVDKIFLSAGSLLKKTRK